jgi:hypothetical protein
MKCLPGRGCAAPRLVCYVPGRTLRVLLAS